MSSLLVFNRVYRLEIQSVMLVLFSTHLCVLLTTVYRPSNLPHPSPLPFPKSKYSIYRQYVAGGGEGGGELSCVGNCIMHVVNTLFLTRFRTYKIDTPPQTKT
jgi:hypothetical protein